MVFVFLFIGAILGAIAGLGYSSRTLKAGAEEPDRIPPEKAASADMRVDPGFRRTMGAGDD
jgi:hypothetical protein